MRMSSWVGWGCVLGFALGGFFDGILLHQILQWHHLLSLAPAVTDLRMQVLWDGYFHALMYVIAIAGLWGLWRAHRKIGDIWGRQLVGALAIGFGLWHIVDAVLSHWLLGIHRIKLDSPNPLFWDLLWFVVFGVTPLVIGWFLLSRVRRPAGLSRPGSMALIALTCGTIVAGAWSLRPPADLPFTTVVFRPGVSPAEVFAAMASLDARLVWTDPAMGVVVVDIAPTQRWGFYGKGALLVSGSGVPAGCLTWTRV